MIGLRHLSTDPRHVQQKISKNMNLILHDWMSLFSQQENQHDYSIYRRDLRFRLAPRTEPGGIALHGLWAFRLARPTIRTLLSASIYLGGYGDARMTCLIDKESFGQDGGLVRSFKWRVEGSKAKEWMILVSGMAHYGFDGSSGLVSSIQVDRIVPPLKPGMSILSYLRLLQNLSAPSHINIKQQQE